MSVLVKKKRTRILSTCAGANSLIRNIQKKYHEFIVVNEKGDKSVKRVRRDEITYDIFFNVDMRRVLSSNIEYLEFRVLSSSTKKSIGLFEGMVGTVNQNRVIAAAHGKRKENLKTIASDRKDKTLGTGKIDLRQLINETGVNASRGSIRGKSDRELFGVVKKNSVVSVERLRKKGLTGTRLTQTQSPTVDRDKVRNEQFQVAYISAIDKNIDPGMAYVGIVNTSNSSPEFGNYIVTSQLDEKNYTKSVGMNTLRSSFESIPKKPITTTGDSNRFKSNTVAIVTESVDRVKRIRHTFKIFTQTLGALRTFVVAITVKDPETGMIMEYFELEIPHRVNIENYYIPEKIPDISILRKVQSDGLSEINANFTNIGDKVSDISISSRKIVDDLSLSISSFAKGVNASTTGEMKKVKNQSCSKVKIKSRVGMYEQVIVRVQPISVMGLKLSNFSSDVIAGENFNYVNAQINSHMSSTGVKIECQSTSPNVSGLAVYKKKKGYTKWLPTIRPGMSANIAPSFLTIKDTEISDRDVVSYRLKLFFKNGADQFSRQSSTIFVVSSLNYFGVTISNLLIRSLNSVKFDVAIDFKSTNTDLILQVLRDTGNEDLFSDDIDTVTSSLSDLALFGVERVNVTTSESEFLGYYSPGTFEDNGSHGSILSLGMKYKYYVTAYLTNPDQVSRLMNASVSLNKSVVQTTSDIRLPSGISKIQNSIVGNVSDLSQQAALGVPISAEEEILIQSSYTSTKLTKNFSTNALQTGMIGGVSSISQDYDIGTYSTGDFTTVNVDLTKMSYTITSKSTTSVTRSSIGAPVLRFSIVPLEISSLKMIDFVVISCERNGQDSICGVCHNDLTGNFVFVDYTNKEYIGKISYKATIVLITGDKMHDKNICNTTLVEMYPKQKKVGR